MVTYCDMCEKRSTKRDMFECLDCGDLICFSCVDMGKIGNHTFEGEDEW